MFKPLAVVAIAAALSGCVAANPSSLAISAGTATSIGVALSKADDAVSELSHYCGLIDTGLSIASPFVTGPKTSKALSKAQQVFTTYCIQQPTNVASAAVAAVRAVATLRAASVPVSVDQPVVAASLAK